MAAAGEGLDEGGQGRRGGPVRQRQSGKGRGARVPLRVRRLGLVRSEGSGLRKGLRGSGQK